MRHTRSAREDDRGVACTATIAPQSQLTMPRRSVVAWMGASILGVPSASAQAPKDAQRKLEIGETLGDDPLQGLNGPAHRLHDFRGHPLIINVWASWCGPCRQEMASLERLAWRQDPLAFNIIGISTDDDAAAARRLLAATNATLSHFIDSHLHWETLLGASRIPLTVLVDSGSRVVDRIYGAQRWDGGDAARLISKAFGGSPHSQPAHSAASR
jgi:thiol-disulfide isomerase/thioredoxin